MDGRPRRADASARTRTPRSRAVPSSEPLERRVLLSASPAGPEFLVNPPGDGFHATNHQSVAVDADGNSVVTWSEGDSQAYARRYDAAGGALGDAFRVLAGNPSVAVASGGEFVIVVSRGYPGRFGMDIVARRYSAAGTPLGQEFIVNGPTPAIRQRYSVAMNDAGAFVIAWSNANGPLFARSYDSSGVPQGAEFLVDVPDGDESDSHPSVAIGAGGEFVVAWGGTSRPPPEERQRIDVYARRYSADSEPLGEKFVVNPPTTEAFGSSVAMEEDGDFVIAYYGSGTHVRRYSAAGAELGDPVFLSAEGIHVTPLFSMEGDVRGFLGVWQRTIRSGPTRPDVDIDVYAQCFDAAGQPLGDEFVVNTTTAGVQDEPAVAVDDEGNFIVAWTTWDAEWTVSDVYARRYVSSDPPPPPATLAARHVFYNNSGFDGNAAAADARDDGAIAADKTPLLPGQAASFSNVSTYDRGINGVMLDVANLPADVTLTPDDFEFGGDGTPPLSVKVRRGAGVGGSDRVTLTWPDYNPLTDPPVMAVGNGWLTVTVKANGHTGLAQPDVFSFGNLIGETGDGSGAAGWRVTALDLSAVKRAINAPTALTSLTDFNRDGRTNALDLSVVRRALNRALPLPTAPAAFSYGSVVHSVAEELGLVS